jgi:hypothetical protein
MAAHEDKTESDKKSQRSARELREPIVNLVAGIVRWVGLLFAVILVLHVVLTIGEANSSNGIAEFVRNWADTVSIGFKNLFTPSEAKLKVLVNYGIAALFWLIVSSIVSKLIKRLA